MITVDQGKCVGCGMCNYVCPGALMGMQDKKAYIAKPETCISCFHCAAACPTGAISNGDQPAVLEKAVEFGPEFAGTLADYLRSRRSIRRFKPQAVDEGLLQEALTLSQWAPSACNYHPLGWVVVNGKEKIDEMMELILQAAPEQPWMKDMVEGYARGSNYAFGNAHTMLFCYEKPNTGNAGLQDVAVALTYISLYLSAKGVGTCWSGWAKHSAEAVPAIRDGILKIPQDCVLRGAVMVGYPDENYPNIPARSEADVRWVK